MSCDQCFECQVCVECEKYAGRIDQSRISCDQCFECQVCIECEIYGGPSVRQSQGRQAPRLPTTPPRFIPPQQQCQPIDDLKIREIVLDILIELGLIQKKEKKKGIEVGGSK